MATKAKEKPKPSAPLPSSQPIALEDLFSDLHRHSQKEEYDQVIKVADRVLEIAPEDEDALRCKVVALIKSDAIEGALSAIEDCEGPSIDLNFYKAYCMYRQNKLHEALETLDGQERNALVLQLESQILYRLFKMDACMESYEKLQKFKFESMDFKANIIAALISAGRAAEVQQTMDALKVKPSSSFELAYNNACSLIEKKKYADAEQQLLSARRIGQEMLMDEDCTNDVIETELAPINVQLAYVHQLLGRKEEAIEAYTNIIETNLADASTLAVATNNLIALKGTKESSNGLRKLEQLIEKDGSTGHFQLANGLEFKLFPKQKEALYSSRVLLLLHANRMDQAQELVSALLILFPDSTVPILLQAALLVREKNVSKAEKILGQYAEKFPDKAKPVLLARAQIAAAAGHSSISAESLSRISDIQHMPATVATIVSLKEKSGDLDSAASVLDSAIQWWKNSMNGEKKLEVIMQEAAAFNLGHGREDEASRLYEELVRSHGSTSAVAGLVATASGMDIEKAELYEKRLRALPGLKEIDVESLEKTSGAKRDAGLVNPEVPVEVKDAKAKKRKRKPRYPKGFDPANPGPPPDPERWLPKRERSSYRPKRKDKRGSQVRGSQGSVAKDAAANTASSSLNLKSNASSSKGAAQKSSQQPKGSSKSKKKSRS